MEMTTFDLDPATAHLASDYEQALDYAHYGLNMAGDEAAPSPAGTTGGARSWPGCGRPSSGCTTSAPVSRPGTCSARPIRCR